jgi:UDP-N-acetylmuramoylalanine--D-glutamate ligase
MIDVTPFVKTLNGKPVAVFGLGLSGLSTAKALKAAGAKVVAWDDNEESRLKASEAGIELSSFAETDFKNFACLVLAPGIPLTHPEPHPVAAQAIEAGIEIVGDLEIFHRAAHGRKTVGITGTNGKSTTTALVTHILKESGVDAIMGGNIGKPVFDIDLPGPGGVIVLEVSSYQMDLCPTFRPDISVLLNITPDHLDRHGSLEGYATAKERIFEGEGVAVCNTDDTPSQMAYERVVKSGVRKAISLSLKKQASGVFVDGVKLYDAVDQEAVEVASLSDITTLPGSHNHQNAAAAYAVCKSLGLSPEQIVAGMKTYPGLPHRQFITRVINGIAYVNDSKATNAEAMVRALACYGNIYLIAGGRAKEGGLAGIESYIDKIRHVFLIGESVDDFAKYLGNVGIPHTMSRTLDVAVLEAHTMAQAGRGQPGGAGTVLLSPACASWDQFRSFEHRGDTFAQLVNALSEEAPA